MTIGQRSEFGDHLKEMVQHWRTILLLSWAIGGLVFVLRSAQPDVFESSTGLRLSVDSELFDDGSTTEFQTRSLAEVARTPGVVEDAVASSGLDLSVEEATDLVVVNLRDTPGFLEVTVDGPSGEDARDLANAMALALVAVVEQQAPTSAVSSLTVTVPAEAPLAPKSPRPLREGFLAGLVMLLLTSEAVIWIRKLRGHLSPVAPAADVERLLSVPTLSVGSQDPAGVLPFVIQHLNDRPVITVVQRGATPSVAAVHLLGRILSGVHRRVLVIDADVGQPVLHQSLGVRQAPGLSEVLAGTQTLGSVLQRAGNRSRAAIVAAGNQSVGGIAGHQRLLQTRQLVQEAAADRVIISASQASGIDEAMTVAHLFGDAVVLALDPKGCTSRSLRLLSRQIRDANAHLVAVILVEAGTGTELVIA